MSYTSSQLSALVTSTLFKGNCSNLALCFLSCSLWWLFLFLNFCHLFLAQIASLQLQVQHNLSSAVTVCINYRIPSSLSSAQPPSVNFRNSISETLLSGHCHLERLICLASSVLLPPCDRLSDDLSLFGRSYGAMCVLRTTWMGQYLCSTTT